MRIFDIRVLTYWNKIYIYIYTYKTQTNVLFVLKTKKSLLLSDYFSVLCAKAKKCFTSKFMFKKISYCKYMCNMY